MFCFLFKSDEVNWFTIMSIISGISRDCVSILQHVMYYMNEKRSQKCAIIELANQNT